MVACRVRLVCFLFVLAWSPVCRAQQVTAGPQPAAPSESDEMLYGTRRVPELAANRHLIPASTTVITADDIRRSAASTIQEAIMRSTGVQFSDQQGFGLGSDSTLNLRGVVNSSRTNALVLVDGVRQNRITGDEVHWQSIPVDQVERIEILRGGGGLIYGEGALAGVINIITKHSADKLLETEGGVEVGSFGWQQYHAAVRGRFAPVTYGTNYTRRLVTGYRESSWSRNTTITTHAGIQPVSWLSGAVNVLHSEDTTAFPGGLTETQVQQRRRQAKPSFHGFNDNDIDQVSLDLIAGPWEGLSGVVNLFWRRWVQTSQDSINFDSFTVAPSRGLSVRTNSEWTGSWASNLLVNGMELMDDKATTGDRDAFPGPDDESNRKGYGLFLEDTLTLWDRVSLVGGLRLDKSRYKEAISFPSYIGTLRFQGFSPKAGITYSLIPKQLDVFASYSRPFKAPNVDDFSARVSSFSGNVNLKPQQADTYEVGTRWARQKLHTEATWFYTLTDDEILFNGVTSQNDNFDTRRVGVELSARMEPIEQRVRSSLAYTFVNADFRKGSFAGHLVPGTPRHTVHASLGASPVEALWIDLDWDVVNDFFRINDMANRLGKAKHYDVLSLRLQYELPKKYLRQGWPTIRGYVKVENLLNKHYVTFQSSNGVNLSGGGEFPMPPTTFTGGVSVQF